MRRGGQVRKGGTGISEGMKEVTKEYARNRNDRLEKKIIYIPTGILRDKSEKIT